MIEDTVPGFLILVLFGAGCGPPAAVIVETAERRAVPVTVDRVARTEAATTASAGPVTG